MLKGIMGKAAHAQWNREKAISRLCFPLVEMLQKFA